MTLSKWQNFHWMITLSSLITHSFIYSINIFWLLTRWQHNSRYQEYKCPSTQGGWWQTTRQFQFNRFLFLTPMTGQSPTPNHFTSRIYPESTHVSAPLHYHPGWSQGSWIQAWLTPSPKQKPDEPDRGGSTVVSHHSSEPCLLQEWDHVFWATGTLCAKARRPRALRRTSFDAWTWY